MSHALAEIPYDLHDAIENIVTEDDEPVDNLFSEKQQRLFANSLYSSWLPPTEDGKKTKTRRKFLAAANVGIFFAVHDKPLVPDFFLSLDVAPHQHWYEKQHCTYFVWEFGKVPELVLEIVSNRKGKELDSKFKDYARMGVNYYVVYDPQQQLGKEALTVYELGFGKRYRPRKDLRLPELGLSLKLWRGVFETHRDTWVRWCDAKGQLLLTGEERAAKAETQTQQAKRRAAEVETQAQQASRRAAEAEAELEKLRAELTQLKRPTRKKSAK